MRYISVLLFFLTIGIFTSYGQQLSYKPLNPAFGGDTFNYNWLLSAATSQNGFKAPSSAREQESDLDRFGNNINSQILSQISRSLLQQQVNAIGNFTEPGTYTYGTLNIEVFESDEGLVINILDTATGEQTQVIVPN